MNQLQNSVQTEFEIETYENKNQKNNSEKQNLAPKKSVSLTQRDYEVLLFLIEMKFSSLDEISFKFFKSYSKEGKIVPNTYVIKRLAQLIKDGFLKSTRAFDATKRLYYPTIKSYLMLTKLYPEKVIVRPSGNIDGRTVVHDYYLLVLRLRLENLNKAHDWISDRIIKTTLNVYNELGSGNTPDGIYTDVNGQSVAMELEVSVKSKARYLDKVKKYVSFIRAHEANPQMIKRVHYVVFAQPTYKHLTEYTSLYKHFFTIEKASDFGLKNGVSK